MKIQVNKDYIALAEVFIRNDLENPTPELDEVLKAWELIEDNSIVGGCSLAKTNGNFILENFAIDKDYRGNGWSKLLLDKVFEYLKEKNAQKLYINTKIPDYFKKIDFNVIKREEAPDFSECFTCDQYLVDCFPEVMVKNL